MAHKSDARKKKKKLNTETAAIPNNGMEETDCRYQKKTNIGNRWFTPTKKGRRKWQIQLIT